MLPIHSKRLPNFRAVPCSQLEELHTYGSGPEQDAIRKEVEERGLPIRVYDGIDHAHPSLHDYKVSASVVTSKVYRRSIMCPMSTGDGGATRHHTTDTTHDASAPHQRGPVQSDPVPPDPIPSYHLTPYHHTIMPPDLSHHTAWSPAHHIPSTAYLAHCSKYRTQWLDALP